MSKTSSRTTSYALVITGLQFFGFGFVTWLNGTMMPFLKLACQLTSDIQAFLVASASYMAYFVLAVPSAAILRRTGYKNGMALGLLIMALGALVIIPAAQMRSFPVFLVGFFLQAAGMALGQTAVNPYITILGPIDSAARRISIMGLCNKAAGVLAPLIIGAIVLKDASAFEVKLHAAATDADKNVLLNSLASRAILPYIVIAGILVLLSIAVKTSSLPEINPEEEEIKGHDGKKTSIFQFPHLLLGVLCIFLYVGVEVLAGDGIGMFGRSLGISLDKARYFTSFTMIGMLIGYSIGIIAIPKYLSQSLALRICAVSGLIFSVGVLATTGYTSVTFIALLGLSNSLMWPAIWPLALEGLGRFTKMAGALLIMGIVGGALVPLAYPAIRDSLSISNNLAFAICAMPCYAFILYYAVRGHLAGRQVESPAELAKA